VNLYRDLPLKNQNGQYHVVVEVTRGSPVKLKYDSELGAFIWSRALSMGVVFPFDYGFLPQTLAEDNDAADAVVLTPVASHPGVVIPTRIIGALRVEQKRGAGPIKRNDRIITAPCNEHRYAHINSVTDLATRVRDEIQAFFSATLVLTGKTVQFCGWADATEAHSLVNHCAQEYKNKLTTE